MNYFLDRKIPAFGRSISKQELDWWNRIQSNANVAGPWGYRIRQSDGKIKPRLFATNLRIYQDYCRNAWTVASVTNKMICHYFSGKALWISSALDRIESDGSCFIECLIDLDNKQSVISKSDTKKLAISLAEDIGIKSLLYPSTNFTGYHIPFRIKLPYHINANHVWLVMDKLQYKLNAKVEGINSSLGVDVCGKPFHEVWKEGKLVGVRCSDNIVKLPDNMSDDAVFERWLGRSVVLFDEVEELVKDIPDNFRETEQENWCKANSTESFIIVPPSEEEGLLAPKTPPAVQIDVPLVPPVNTPPSPLVCLSKINNSGTIESNTLNLLQKLWDLNPETEMTYKQIPNGKYFKSFKLNKEKFVAYAYSWIAVAYSQDRMFEDKPDRRSTVGVMAVKGMFGKLMADWKVELKHSMHDQTQVQRLLLKFGVLAMINQGYRVGGPEGGKARQIKFLRGCLESLVESGKKLDWNVESVKMEVGYEVGD